MYTTQWVASNPYGPHRGCTLFMALALAHGEYGGAGPPLLILHGLFGSGRNWNAVAKSLCTSRRIYTLDLRNHGRSPWAQTMTYQDHADDIREFTIRHGLRRVSVLGHSMGGKCAMWLAHRNPELVKSLIVVDVAPVRYDHGFDDYARVLQGVDLATITGRSAADMALQPHIQDPGVRAFLLQNLVFEDKSYRWRINLQAIRESMNCITDFPKPPAGALFDGPTVFISGDRSDYIKTNHHCLIDELFPQAKLVRISKAGHWLHTEQLSRFVQAVDEFLKQTDSLD